MASRASPTWNAEQDTWRYLLRIDNHATDWASIAVVWPSQTPSSAIRESLATVRGCLFDGPCVLFVSPGSTVGRLWQARFDSCIVSTSATVEYSALRRAVVRAGATISHCGNVGITSAAASDVTNAHGFFTEPMLLGNSTGGRPAPLCDTLSLADYASLVCFERGAKERIDAIVATRSAVIFGPRRVEVAGHHYTGASHPGLATLLTGGLQWPFCDFGPGALFVQVRTRVWCAVRCGRRRILSRPCTARPLSAQRLNGPSPAALSLPPVHPSAAASRTPCPASLRCCAQGPLLRCVGVPN